MAGLVFLGSDSGPTTRVVPRHQREEENKRGIFALTGQDGLAGCFCMTYDPNTWPTEVPDPLVSQWTSRVCFLQQGRGASVGGSHGQF